MGSFEKVSTFPLFQGRQHNSFQLSVLWSHTSIVIPQIYLKVILEIIVALYYLGPKSMFNDGLRLFLSILNKSSTYLWAQGTCGPQRSFLKQEPGLPHVQAEVSQEFPSSPVMALSQGKAETRAQPYSPNLLSGSSRRNPKNAGFVRKLDNLPHHPPSVQLVAGL